MSRIPPSGISPTLAPGEVEVLLVPSSSCRNAPSCSSWTPGELQSFRRWNQVATRQQVGGELPSTWGKTADTESGIFHALSCQHDVCRQDLTDVSTGLRQFRHYAKHNDGRSRRGRESRRRDRLPFTRRVNVGRVAGIADLPVRPHESWHSSR